MTTYPLHPEHRDELLCIYSDMYKDVHGFRPRHIAIGELSDQELKEDIEGFSEEIKIQIAEQEAYEAKCIAKFEELVANTIEIGAGDRATALRWIYEPFDFEPHSYDIEHFVWKLGFSHTEYGFALEKEMLHVLNPHLEQAA